jgi:hypothetical protein
LYGVRNAANGREQNGKLVPAETGSDILRPDRLLEAPGDLKEDLVGKEVTDRVVRRLESTEVEKEDGERAIAARAKLRKIAKSTKFLTVPRIATLGAAWRRSLAAIAALPRPRFAPKLAAMVPAGDAGRLSSGGAASCDGRDWRRLALTLLCVLTACGGGGSSSALPAPAVYASGPAPTLTVPYTLGASGDDWTTFAHDQLRSGYQAQSIGVTALNVGLLRLKWTAHLGAPFYSSPLSTPRQAVSAGRPLFGDRC